jgi:DNA-binding NarL/FixJ family response regulator
MSQRPDARRSAPAKVLIVDDHPAVREALALRIGRCADLEVVGEASTVAEALKSYESCRPDVAVVDISLKEGSGIDLIKRIKARDPSARLLVWSMYDESLFGERALRAGASGYLSKEKETSEIITALRRVLTGKVYVSEKLSERLLTRATGGGASIHDSPAERLSDRELEVFELIGKGLTTREIAERLHVSVHTVETHRQRIKSKLNLDTSAILSREATQWLLEKG